VGATDPLARALTEIVANSGLSRAEIAHRAPVRPQTLARLRGCELVPATFGQIERVGNACSLTRAAMADLRRTWHRQVHPPPEPPYELPSGPWRSGAVADAVAQVERVLTATWTTLRAEPPEPAAWADLDEVTQALLTALRERPALRAAVRAAVLPAPRRGAPTGVPGWPDVTELAARRAESVVPRHHHESFVPERLAARLVDPDDDVARRAGERFPGWLRAVGRAGDEAPRTDAEAEALLRRAAELVAEQVMEQVAEQESDRIRRADGTAPVDRDVVEDGLRRCYELAGLTWPGQVIWAPSPWAAAVLWPLLSGWGGLLWCTRVHHPDRETHTDRYPHDLEHRLTEDLARVDLRPPALRQALSAMTGPPTTPAASWYAVAGPWAPPYAVLGAVDDAAARRGLREAAAQGPSGSAARLERLLAEHPSRLPLPHQAEYSPFVGQVVAPRLAWADLLARLFPADLPVLFPARLSAYRDASAGGPWWPAPGGVLVADLPAEVHTETVTWADGTPRGRLHRDGAPRGPVAGRHRGLRHARAAPALRPRPVRLARRADPARARRRVPPDRRRAAGWDRFVADARLALVDGPAADPGNPGGTLSLYEYSASVERGARLLLCSNASPERDGSVRRFGLHVPTTVDDAVSAAAWTFGLDRTTYERLERAT